MRDEIMRLAERAADMLDGFEQALRRYAPIEDVEEWPYHPEITDTAAELRALARADHVEDKLGMVPEGCVLLPREADDKMLNSFLSGYGARGGGFNAMHLRDRAREGYRQLIAAAPAPGHSAGVGGMVAKVSAPDGWEFTEGGGVTEVFDIAQWPDIGGIWRDDETGLPVLHAEGDLKDWPSGKINAVLVQVNRAQPADADAEGGK